MRFKDTGLNIRMTEVLAANIFSQAVADAMHICGVPFPPEHDELKAAGLTAMPGKTAASPWTEEAPAAFDRAARRQYLFDHPRSLRLVDALGR